MILVAALPVGCRHPLALSVSVERRERLLVLLLLRGPNAEPTRCRTASTHERAWIRQSPEARPGAR